MVDRTAAAAIVDRTAVMDAVAEKGTDEKEEQEAAGDQYEQMVVELEASGPEHLSEAGKDTRC